MRRREQAPSYNGAMAKPVTKKPAAKRRIAKRVSSVSVEPVPALVDHILAGFTADTAARRIRVGMSEAQLVKLLGKPTTVHRDQDMGSGRRLTEMRWERDSVVAGMTVRDFLGASWTTKPQARGVTSIQRIVSGDAGAKVFRDAFADIKLKLAALYKKGENKSTFRAPGLALEGDIGFVATFHNAGGERAASSLVVNAGVIE